MCGVSVILDKKKQLNEEPIQRMMASLSYRGPDANGWAMREYPNQQIFLGHTRLSIIDADNTASNQPMRSRNQQYWLVYNGEIYNYAELRNELEMKGIQFYTWSDTEVLLEGLANEGADFLDKVNGMYAFVCWDSVKQEIMAFRDPSGMKPLYVYDNEFYTIFSSSIPAIFASQLAEPELNASVVEHYLRYKFSPAPDTFSNHVQLVPVYQPSKITYRFGGRLDQVSPTPNEVVSRMETLLKNSVERHLISDRPVGLFLSGGVDSTLILSLLQDTNGGKFPVFTVGEFKSDGQDMSGSSQVTQDHVFAAMAAKQYGGELVELRLGDEILLEMDQMVAALDQPIADPAALLTYILSREAKKSISVALSGAGGDEVFAGYNRHGAFQSYLGFWRYMPSWMCDGLSLLSKQLFNSPWVPMPRMKQKMVHGEKFFKDISSDPMSTFLNFTSMDFYPPIRNLQRQKGAYSKENYLNQAMATDRKDFLSQDVLALTDQMSMAHALEVRLPYLDKELTDFMDNLPASFVLKHGKKWILNEILLKRNGNPYVLRKKEGFGMPLANWLRKSKNAFVYERLLDPGNSIFEWVDYARAQGIIQKHISHRADFSKEIWALAILERWYEKNRR